MHTALALLKRLAVAWVRRRVARWEAEMTIPRVPSDVQFIDTEGRQWVSASAPAEYLNKRRDDHINPAHYKKPGGVEVVDFIRQQLGTDGFVAYCRGNAVKYLARAGAKAGQPAAQDYAKAAWFAKMAAHALEPDKYGDPRT